MKKWLKVLVATAALSALSTSVFAAGAPVKLDAVHSRIGFTASTLLFDVGGQFKKFDLQVDGDPAKLEAAKILLTIDAASIDTDNSKRDEHLSSADFLDVKKYPKIVFSSESITQSASGVTVIGTLDLHGKKKKLTIPFKKVTGKNGAGVSTTAFKGKLTINRNEFGVGADSVAAKISLEDELALDLLVVAFL